MTGSGWQQEEVRDSWEGRDGGHVGAILGGPRRLGVQVWVGYRNMARRLAGDLMARTLVPAVLYSLWHQNPGTDHSSALRHWDLEEVI